MIKHVAIQVILSQSWILGLKRIGVLLEKWENGMFGRNQELEPLVFQLQLKFI